MRRMPSLLFWYCLSISLSRVEYTVVHILFNSSGKRVDCCTGEIGNGMNKSTSVNSLVHLQAHPIMYLIVGQSDMIFIYIIPI